MQKRKVAYALLMKIYGRPGLSMNSIEHILNMHNYFDGVIITDQNGIIQYYTNTKTELYNLRITEIIGKSILDIHPELTPETSSIMQVLKTGKPIFDQIEVLTNRFGEKLTNIYSTLPLMSNGKIVGAVDFYRCIEEEAMRKSIVLNKGFEAKKDHLFHLEDIIAASVSMKKIKEIIMKVANTESSVLIFGETGTGKELIAQTLHTYSERSNKRFVSQNCAAIPSNLLESILFGTMKGSFTGAENMKGLFEIADGGTLFLDEIHSLDLGMQAKLLKALEEKSIRRVGGTEPIRLNVKIVAALNVDPLLCIKENRLREDLFYRLNVVQINLPPLRERVPDIIRLKDYFIQKYNEKMNHCVVDLSDEVKEIFLSYHWPGNIRELQNTIEGAFNLIDSKYIEKSNLPQYIVNQFDNRKSRRADTMPTATLEEKVSEYEKQLIMEELASSNSISAAAKKLGVSKQTLAYKLKKYQL